MSKYYKRLKDLFCADILPCSSINPDYSLRAYFAHVDCGRVGVYKEVARVEGWLSWTCRRK